MLSAKSCIVCIYVMALKHCLSKVKSFAQKNEGHLELEQPSINHLFFDMSCDLDSLIEDDLVINLHQPPKQSVTIVFGGVGLLLRMERGAKDGKSKASVAGMHEDSNLQCLGRRC